ncbi:DUF1353 domain-containing protein [Helicobacter salomonis]|uniref:DUF1353 domain-containing protein n=1 Tax=Helicobacter salomonis TaxID=56878 RepID=UPI000CF1069E|nr:DUF1353 domain-containing protein [Helicobacter salomonis]
MRSFSEPLLCEMHNDGKTIKVVEGFVFEKRVDFTVLESIEVPAGFTSDGFTNFGLNQLVPRFGKGLKCAILHDYLCEGAHRGEHSRAYADAIFLEALLETRALSRWRAYFLYGCVRIFAWFKGYA